ncbi:hypothetical protein EV193_104273 [Herbihabitans rhizosphaerae]|uniref:Uncharacterized protein n=1 Tax=Herbihabitans rhizosphaerae TaxID=1872711 RepID=A0A4Q7KUB4_9PSEU|nr:DUF6461 domain-containing protein [Herbihabitans rhizosphaerae]RZS39062.1 hypothetical protein EV193_104273 [Herbihabitans rhizosphaerae]
MTEEIIAHYQDLLGEDESLSEALCVTVVESASAEDVLRRMGADVGTFDRRDAEETFDLAGSYQDLRQTAMAGEIDGKVLVVEPNGFQCTRPEVQRALTEDGGSSLTVFWNVNAVAEIVLARDGRMVWSFDPLFYPDDVRGPDTDGAHRAADGLPLGENGLYGARLALLEKETGIRLTVEWLTTPQLSAVIDELPEDVVLADYADHPALTDPEIAALIADPTAADPRLLAVIAVEHAARATGLDDPAAVEILRRLRAGEPVAPQAIEAVQSQVDSASGRLRDARRSIVAAATGDGSAITLAGWAIDHQTHFGDWLVVNTMSRITRNRAARRRRGRDRG